MGIDTFLVLEPGHMFLGIYLDADGKQSACLETTMLGDPDPPKCAENRALAHAATKAVRQLKGWRCFNDALDSATREFKKHKRHFDKGTIPNTRSWTSPPRAARASRRSATCSRTAPWSRRQRQRRIKVWFAAGRWRMLQNGVWENTTRSRSRWIEAKFLSHELVSPNFFETLIDETSF